MPRVPLDSPAVAGKKITLEVQSRTVHGTRAVRRLRRTGLIPGVVYGGKEPPRSIAVQESVLRAALTGEQGRHAIVHVSIDGGTAQPSILKQWQMDPVKIKLRHIDLQEVALDRPMTSSVAVTLVGESPGVKLGGALTQATHEVHVEALPADMPDHIEADISELEVGGQVRIADLVAPKGATILDDPDTLIASVAATPKTAGEDWHADELDAELEAAAAPAATEGEAEPEADAS